ncbi:GDP-mannose mannosyl hydrolase [Vibrio nigripulchritudo SO65]|uniref:GDP-mannose mannosyl hydrolase n=1 Tax=Vibrio nigripulchritudo TaxID=28173 RepID=UPI0003B1C669|nr:GDP-mannose mannosyl hydrolase [Vibrio nigripulchritudo]CCN35033.1 GDP-mannose mannosyl hydrolase [Vibrio nigripulchritudo AM115]CCN41685.1 GDP-mannose mannosyl hydrolase [Vibrio nigripulchritudo FTn2]CCN65064.1 GDP-mannose mannosyl hydrolase [Vibrio nigripulchritudo POn4]CCN74000.1 GDP-mannose mannosyl hydrolase [Vibrio nigripulchritudo SO65]
MFLEQHTFSNVIEHTPLISIDLVIENEEGSFLLGKRLNKPAKNYWFVPGGRVQKNETLEDAFVRLTKNELGEAYSIDDAVLIGPFTHIYDDNVFGDDFGTHYVVLAYRLKIQSQLLKLPTYEQHSKYQWFTECELVNSESVHLHTKWYFKTIKE